MTAKLYRKKTLVRAEQFDWKDGQGIPDIPGVKFELWRANDLGGGLMKNGPVVSTAYIETLEGKLHVSRGDWIITGIEGEKYPCKDHIFHATYEPAE
jgi:hypothetical protein